MFYCSMCLSYENLQMRLSSLDGAVGIEFKMPNGGKLYFSLNLIQGKAFAESLLNVVGSLPVSQTKGEFAGSLETVFAINHNEEETVCQPQNSSVQTAIKSISRIA